MFSIGFWQTAPGIDLADVKYTTGLCACGFFVSQARRLLIRRFRRYSVRRLLFDSVVVASMKLPAKS